MAPRQQNNYGAITVKHDEEEFENLVAHDDESSSLLTTATNVVSNKKFRAALKTVAVLAVLVAAVGFSREWHHQAAFPKKGSKKSSSSSQTSTSTGDEPERDVLLSNHSPMDLGFLSIERAQDAVPSTIWGNRSGPLPTNSWYLNLVSQKASQQPDETTRVYTVPYIIDTAPPSTMAGIRVHWPVVSANDRNIQMVDDYKNGLCMGSSDVAASYQVDPNFPISHLGVSLAWSSGASNSTSTADDSDKRMTSHIVRGMPYATMQYYGGVLPTLYSYNGPASDDSIVADGKHSLKCGSLSKGDAKAMTVNQEVQLHFINSDFTWAVYFSQPVKVVCEVTEGDDWTREFQLRVVSYETSKDGKKKPLTLRSALVNQCTTGKSNIKAHCHSQTTESNSTSGNELKDIADILMSSASTYPTSPRLQFTYPEYTTDKKRIANVTIDWKAESSATSDNDDLSDLVMFALPHHQDSLKHVDNVKITKSCVMTFHGKTCLVKGNVWTIPEDLGPPMSFNAPRPPEADAIPSLAKALASDIQYRLSDNMMRAAADTYFSGKILARVGRVISIASEMQNLAEASSEDLQGMYTGDDVEETSLAESAEAAASENLPSGDEITNAVTQLKKAVQIWLSEKAEAPYVFDKSWGGLVNCGCRYVGKGEHGVCNNTYPDCPALIDVNEDFGNGYYNDHHYHYGYHIYAAAVVAKFDPEWAEKYFEKVLLYIRDIANPSASEKYFTQFRQKDWFLGSSWASGIVSGENSPHGRNQESSSEAIAAYEAIALYGSVMVDVFSNASAEKNLDVAKLVRDSGELLTATEIRAANRYWHVWSSGDHVNTYPEAYKQPVVGMLYETMASFQTWFAPYAVVSYGIQLMPLTPIAEERDDPKWASELYPQYEQACEEAGDFCIDNGWSILQAGLCAEAGDRQEALEQLMKVPSKVFSSDGGVGNSLSNTIWYISTRPAVDTKISTKDESS